MTITLSDIQYLASENGARLLTRISTEDLSQSSTLRLLTTLRKDYSPEQARAGLEMAQLRLKAADKFGSNSRVLFFTRDALEQASDPRIRKYRASQMGARRIVDACCGIGADSIAFAAAGADVTGIDQDAVRIEVARHNANILGLPARFQVGDVCAGLPDSDVVFFDPARRDEQGRRIHNVEQYQPPLKTINNWPHPSVVVKLSPGVDLSQIDSYGGRVEFISVEGDLKEAVLWWDGSPKRLSATLLTQAGDVFKWEASTDLASSEIALSEPRAWLVEPDPALLRAGLVKDAALHFGGNLLDDLIAYFTTDQKPASPWVRSWSILDWMPFNLKHLRAYLRDHHVGNVTVKKRGTAVTPDTLIPQLKLKGDESRVLVLTRCQGRQIVLICADVSL
ncbi:MAG: methyltransferase domain-containing protein [Anaerolineaceae bacterium]|nr:methyltransferase domain-containing protein [Anaerolineaceae bacterium]